MEMLPAASMSTGIAASSITAATRCSLEFPWQRSASPDTFSWAPWRFFVRTACCSFPHSLDSPSRFTSRTLKLTSSASGVSPASFRWGSSLGCRCSRSEPSSHSLSASRRLLDEALASKTAAIPTARKLLLALPLLRADRTIDVGRKFDEEIQQRAVSGLSQHGAATLGKGVARVRFPRGRNQSPTERTAIQCPLRPQLLLAFIVGKKITHNRMPRPGPEAAALALIVARLIFQRRIPQVSQAIGCNELSFAGCEPLPISTPTAAPLRWRPTHLES